MAKSLNEVGAAVPLLALGGIGSIHAPLQVQRFPSGKERADVEWKVQPVARRFGVDRVTRHHERVDCVDVILGDFGEVVVGERRVQVATLEAHTFVHRA